MRKSGAAIAVAVTALVLAMGAGAQARLQTPKGQQGPAGAVQQQVRAGSGQSQTPRRLPFTGLDLALGVGDLGFEILKLLSNELLPLCPFLVARRWTLTDQLARDLVSDARCAPRIVIQHADRQELCIR